MNIVDVNAIQELFAGIESKNIIDPKELNTPVSSLCMHIGCSRKANHHYPGFQPAYCATHAKNGMKLQPKRKCRMFNCSELAVFADALHRNINGVYCCFHKPEHNVVNVVRLSCKICKTPMPGLIEGRCGKCDRKKKITFQPY